MRRTVAISANEAMTGCIGRQELLLWLAAAILANFALHILDTSSLLRLGSSLASLSLVYWLAAFVIINRLRQSGDRSPATMREQIAIVAGLILLLLSSLAGYRAGPGLVATGSAVLIIACLRNDADTRASATVLLALAGNMLWAPAAFQLATRELLLLDAVLVGTVLNLFRPEVVWQDLTFHAMDGNAITLVGGCSSFNNISIALLACVAATMLVRTHWRRGDIWVAIAAVVAMTAINVLRLCLMATGAAAHAYWHDGEGAHVIALAQTLAIAAIAFGGAGLAGRRP